MTTGFIFLKHLQLKLNEEREVITLKDSPCMYNTPCYLLPSSSTTTSSTATPPYLPTPSSTSTPLLPTPTIVHHLAATPQPAPYFAFTGAVKPQQQQRENAGRFSTLRYVMDGCFQNEDFLTDV